MKLSDVIPTVVEYMNTKEEKGSDEPEEEESEEKEMQKELYENIKHHDCIYFVESNNNAQTPFWCIKDNYDFVEL